MGKTLAILVASALVFSLIAVLLIINPPALSAPIRIAYSTHNPILINGTAEFLGPMHTTGVTGGSGTIGDPYIIEGWDIDASGSNGIDIQNADVHFLIRNC